MQNKKVYWLCLPLSIGNFFWEFLCGLPQWSSWRYFIGLMNLFFALLYFIFYYINILSLINLYLEKYKIIKVTTSYIVFFIVARWFSKSMTFVKWKLPLKHPIERRSIKSQSNTSKNNLNIHRSTTWLTLNQQNIATKVHTWYFYHRFYMQSPD